ncbi:hypothetical protein CN497_25160, partial [Priestia megaterium]
RGVHLAIGKDARPRLDVGDDLASVHARHPGTVHGAGQAHIDPVAAIDHQRLQRHFDGLVIHVGRDLRAVAGQQLEANSLAVARLQVVLVVV